MHLKRLQLIGFKTFADRTEIQFAPGVTAIVGPNGSGKSNIADAILWVLGEQRASAIRGTKLQDVIFSGSSLRKATGLAEVSLTVDNSDGSLPLAFDEITITRRAYRNGEGEFFINKTPCRLRDIHELFLDTGVGRESYALVNQSEVDAVLSADPQARRPLFEEAAGIHKFRVKKREALRKLEATENNLVRIRDIVREIERQLGPLEVQAEVAIRYNTAKERLESLEKNFLIAEVRQIDADLSAQEHDRLRAAAIVDEKTAILGRVEDQSAALSQTLAEVEAQLDGVRLRHQAAMSHVERLRSERELAGQRGQGIGAQIDLIKAEIEDIESRLEAARDALGDSSAQSADAQQQIVECKARIDTLDNQRRDILPRIADIRRSEETRLQRAAERERAKAARDGELASLQARATQTEAQERELSQRVAEIAERSSVTGLEQSERKAEHERAVAQLTSATGAFVEAERAVQVSRDVLAQSQSRISKLQADMASLWSRLQTLQELEAAQEGYYSGVRAVLQAARRGRLQGEFTVVADAFRAPDGYDIAFEVALAGSVQDIIVDTEAEAKAGIELLKRERAGRATFLPLSRIRPAGPRPSVPSSQSGYLGCAADLATFDERYRNVIEMLLGRVLICETIDDALRVADRSRGWSRVVTLTGEVLSPNGAMSGGSAAKASGSLLHRKTEIAGLVDRTAAGKTQLDLSEHEVVQAQAALAGSLAAQSQAQTVRQQRQQELVSVDRALDQVTRDSERYDRERQQLDGRLGQVRAELLRAQEALESKQEAARALDSAMEVSHADQTSTAGESSLMPMLVESEQRLQDELLQLRVQLASAQEKARSQAQTLRNAQLEIERSEVQRSRRTERLAALIAESSALEGRGDDLGVRSEQAAVELAAIQAELEVQQSERHKFATEARAAQMHARTLAEERGAAQTAMQQAELRETRLQMQQAQSAARLLEDYDTTVADALALRESPQIAADTPREVARLRRELRGFGDVNTHAAVEYEDLRLRYESISTQQQDAEAAKAKVLEAIKEIDDSTRGLFMGAFHEVAVAFEEIFQRLMGGGRTELSLTDPDNLLETGVEIVVQAPGKKKQNLMLLSGGERALTAVALLFAFLKVRPAPFCVMDEVDAPLDGVNVERFADLLRDFGRTGQFLIITHNPSTMEAARCWYGVTMQEPGVSRVLSMEAPIAADTDVSRATMEPMAA